jgi:hypothetical protein
MKKQEYEVAQWHVNPATGEAGKCSAAYRCPFGGELGGHKNTKKDAAGLYESYRTGLHEPDQASRFYFISDDENEMFTWGDCGHLAREIHQKTGYPVNAIGIRIPGQTEVSWQHMTVKAPDGRFLDVTGIQPEAILKKAWSSHLSLEPGEELVIEELDQKNIEEYLGNTAGQKMYPNSDPSATAVKVLNALQEKF